jgi:hypothetical protein
MQALASKQLSVLLGLSMRNQILRMRERKEQTVTDIEFKAWPKIARLNRRMIITEKIDGTNAAVIVTEGGQVYAQSRTRLITPGKTTDNFGFAAWVEQNKVFLAERLGPGYHYGEWWGVGIQRGYGLRE